MLIHGDGLLVLDEIEKVDAIFADPPDNIGLEYNGFEDKIPRYYEWIELLIRKSMNKSRLLWLSYNSIHTLEITAIFNRLKRAFPSWNYRMFVWRYTFGQYSEKISYGYRPIVCWSQLTEFDYDSIRIPSRRMELGDARASGPRVPDDVWEFPRVMGNYRERRAWHPTQHPEKLIERILLLSGAKRNGFTVYDPFLGSGTTAIVAKRLGINWIGAEISDHYYRELSLIL